MSAAPDPRKQVLERVHALVDSYHSMPHPAELRRLYEIRRDLTNENMNLTKFVKGTYGRARLSYAQRKWTTAAHIASALEEDAKKIKSERTAMNALEVKAEALATALLMKTQEIDAEGDWEELTATLKAVDKVLMAVGQEITDGRKQLDYDNYLEGLQRKEQAEQH